MSNNTALSCPTCGAGVTEGQRNCSFCHFPVATVHCPKCHHMNHPSCLHCAGCGADLGLQLIPEKDSLVCPRCQLAMQVYAAGDSEAVRDCSDCGGQFVEHHVLRALLERRLAYGAAAPRRALAPATTAAVRYLPCPACQRLMNRRNFGNTSGVIVDICADHGVWLDQGELPALVAFVEAGGLARSMQRAEEEARLKKWRDTPPSNPGQFTPALGADARFGHGFHNAELGPVVIELLETLGSGVISLFSSRKR